MLETVLQIVGSLALALASVTAAWFTFRSTRKRDKITAEVSKEANAITYAENLTKRVEILEERDEKRGEEMRGVKRELDEVKWTFKVSLNYIERFLQWAKDGSRPPIPDIPDSLREHLDPSLITEHHRQQQEHNPKEGS